MSQYVKVSDGVYVKTTDIEPEVIKIADLEAEITELENMLNTTEPTDEELLEWAKTEHFYYADKMQFEDRLNTLTTLRDELSEL